MKALLEDHCTEGSSADVLYGIWEEGVNLAIWHRSSKSAASAAIRALLEAPGPILFDQKTPAKPDVVKAVGAVVGNRARPESIAALAGDVVAIARFFGSVAGVKHPRVRLERVEDNGCALFHADTLKVRMLCTYAGPGTEWLANDNVHHDELGARGRTLEDANAAIVRDPDAIRQFPAWAVAVFTGRGREGTLPLIHRSAPVAGPKDFRLRLCIDVPDDCGC